MFEAITFKNSISPGHLIDIGAVAESLLFYGRVSIVGNSATLDDLLSQIPPLIVLTLLRDGRLEFHYLSDQIGVSTSPIIDGKHSYGLVGFSSPDQAIENYVPKAFVKAAGNTGQARMVANKFASLLIPIDHLEFRQEAVLAALTDNAAIDHSVSSLIGHVAPTYQQGDPVHFRIEGVSTGFHVETNLDFQRLNESYHQTVPAAHSSMTEAYIVALLQGTYETNYFAATLSSEIAVDPIERTIQPSAIEAVVKRHTQTQGQVENFVGLTLDNTFAIREAVNSGLVPFTKVLRLLDSADKFRHWLHAQDPDANLVKAYHDEILRKTWAEKLPTKTARWSVFTGIGLGIDALVAGGIGTAAATAISAIDQFFIDKLLQGWKPHHFVQGELIPVFGKQHQNAKK